MSENAVRLGELRHDPGHGPLLGTSPAMQKLFGLIARVSKIGCPVLILGESGTGKELVAQAIHLNGTEANRPFLAVDCGALVPTLIETELFGYARGAFTGAVCAKAGLLESAHGGTVFLDEIGELPLGLQVKLLRALQEKEIRPVGSLLGVKIQARIIAATNRDLDKAIQEGTFRKDLYFRLNVVGLRISPLREHKGDIPLLITHFLEKFRISGQPRFTFSEQAMDMLLAHEWPGNVRELENCVEGAVALGSGPILQSTDLSSNVQNCHPPSELSPANGEKVIPLQDVERHAILQGVKDSHGDKLLAARRLGMGKTTLYRKLREYQS